MSYYSKYIKYKNKYIKLKNQVGGDLKVTLNTETGKCSFNNKPRTNYRNDKTSYEKYLCDTTTKKCKKNEDIGKPEYYCNNELAKDEINPIVWEKMSCYIDTVFMALFFNPNETIRKKIIIVDPNELVKIKRIRDCDPKDVHTEIINIYKNIYSVSKDSPKCSNIRAILHNCNPSFFRSYGETGNAASMAQFISEFYNVPFYSVTLIPSFYTDPTIESILNILSNRSKFDLDNDEMLMISLRYDHTNSEYVTKHLDNIAKFAIKLNGKDWWLSSAIYRPSVGHVAAYLEKEGKWFNYTFSNLEDLGSNFSGHNVINNVKESIKEQLAWRRGRNEYTVLFYKRVTVFK